MNRDPLAPALTAILNATLGELRPLALEDATEGGDGHAVRALRLCEQARDAAQGGRTAAAVRLFGDAVMLCTRHATVVGPERHLCSDCASSSTSTTSSSSSAQLSLVWEGL